MSIEELVLFMLDCVFFALVGHPFFFFTACIEPNTQLAIVYSYYHVLSCNVEFNPIY